MVPLRPLESGAVSFRKESRALPETGSDVDPGVLSSKAAVL